MKAVRETRVHLDNPKVAYVISMENLAIGKPLSLAESKRSCKIEELAEDEFATTLFYDGDEVWTFVLPSRDAAFSYADWFLDGNKFQDWSMSE